MDDVGQRRGLALDRAAERIAAERAEADDANLFLLTLKKGHSVVVAHQQDTAPIDDLAGRGEVQRDDRDLLQMDVLPDVQLGPVAHREYPDRFPLIDPSVVKIPQLRALIFGIPAMGPIPKAKHAFLGTTLLFVATSAPKRCIKTVLGQGRLERVGFHQLRMTLAVFPRGNIQLEAVLIDVHQQLKPQLVADIFVTELDHLPELIGRVDVQQGKRGLRWVERLCGEMQQHGRVLADRVQHHRLAELGHNLSHDVNALGLKLLQVGQVVVGHHAGWGG